jgi:hypothetical protein
LKGFEVVTENEKEFVKKHIMKDVIVDVCL